MHEFRLTNSRLWCESVPLDTLIRRFGTPLFVYSQRTIARHFQELSSALAPLDHLICYAAKANSNLAVLRACADLGAGFDIVSQGELRRVLAAGGNATRCVFAGVGKTESEIELALRCGIYCLNAESESELERIDRVAGRLKLAAPVAVRANPNVDARTHAKITTGTYDNKFGIAFDEVAAAYARAARLKHLRLRGVQMHIGSQLTSVAPFERAVSRMVPLVRDLSARYGLEFFSIGGGLGIVYKPALASGTHAWWKTRASRGVLTAVSFANALIPSLRPLGIRVLVEPGRFIVGNAGVLLTRVEYLKQTGRKRFVIVDAAMNDLIRPAFYEAYHEIVPLRRRPGPCSKVDVVGPVCESGDFFAKERLLPRLNEGDYLAIMSAGAYGSVMSSNYNSRPFPAEVLVNGSRVALVRTRQTIDDIWVHEQVAHWQRQSSHASRSR